MRIVLQRVKSAKVYINNQIIGQISKGLLLLLAIHKNDTIAQADFLCDKCVSLRIFPDENGKMNKSLLDISGSVLVVSQFTLYGDCKKGRRPSFTGAAPADKGLELYNYFVAKIKTFCKNVETGEFGAMMDVELINDGPVTLILEANNDKNIWH